MFMLLFQVLPKNFVSRSFGRLARVERPRWFVRLVCRAFAALYRIDFSDSIVPPAGFRSLEDLFTRALRPGARTFATGWTAPSDGRLTVVAPVVDGTLIQAKGLTYSARELVFGKEHGANSDSFNAAWFATVYLAPHNYHRVHAPMAGTLVSVRHIPGTLWPVNSLATRRVSALFCANERLVFEIRPDTGGRLFVVMVGALNVGRMSASACPGLFTNDGTRESRYVTFDPPVSTRIGDELGVFHLGSTVVMVADAEAAGAFDVGPLAESRVIRVGEAIAKRCQTPLK